MAGDDSPVDTWNRKIWETLDHITSSAEKPALHLLGARPCAGLAGVSAVPSSPGGCSPVPAPPGCVFVPFFSGLVECSVVGSHGPPVLHTLPKPLEQCGQGRGPWLRAEPSQGCTVKGARRGAGTREKDPGVNPGLRPRGSCSDH